MFEKLSDPLEIQYSRCFNDVSDNVDIVRQIRTLLVIPGQVHSVVPRITCSHTHPIVLHCPDYVDRFTFGKAKYEINFHQN